MLYRNEWCSICSTHISELICRFYFEEFLDHLFPKKRPNWLRNDNGNKMELDGYCEKLDVAFEYDGKQHFEAIKIYGGKSEFNKRFNRDRKKDELCKQKGVTLIRVPYYFDFKEMGNYILKSLRKIGIKIIKKDVDYRKFPIDYKSKTNQYLLSIKDRTIIPLEPYVKAKTKIKHKCLVCGCVWKIAPDTVKNQRVGCPECEMKRKIQRCRNVSLTKDEVRRRINKSGYKWKDNIFRGASKELSLICPRGHEWITTLNNFWDTKKDEVKKHCRFCPIIKICNKCNKNYESYSNNSKYCPTCRK